MGHLSQKFSPNPVDMTHLHLIWLTCLIIVTHLLTEFMSWDNKLNVKINMKKSERTKCIMKA